MRRGALSDDSEVRSDAGGDATGRWCAPVVAAAERAAGGVMEAGRGRDSGRASAGLSLLVIWRFVRAAREAPVLYGEKMSARAAVRRPDMIARRVPLRRANARGAMLIRPHEITDDAPADNLTRRSLRLTVARSRTYIRCLLAPGRGDGYLRRGSDRDGDGDAPRFGCRRAAHGG